MSSDGEGFDWRPGRLMENSGGSAKVSVSLQAPPWPLGPDFNKTDRHVIGLLFIHILGLRYINKPNKKQGDY